MSGTESTTTTGDNSGAASATTAATVAEGIATAESTTDVASVATGASATNADNNNRSDNKDDDDDDDDIKNSKNDFAADLSRFPNTAGIDPRRLHTPKNGRSNIWYPKGPIEAIATEEALEPFEIGDRAGFYCHLCNDVFPWNGHNTPQLNSHMTSNHGKNWNFDVNTQSQTPGRLYESAFKPTIKPKPKRTIAVEGQKKSQKCAKLTSRRTNLWVQSSSGARNAFFNHFETYKEHLGDVEPASVADVNKDVAEQVAAEHRYFDKLEIYNEDYNLQILVDGHFIVVIARFFTEAFEPFKRQVFVGDERQGWTIPKCLVRAVQMCGNKAPVFVTMGPLSKFSYRKFAVSRKDENGQVLPALRLDDGLSSWTVDARLDLCVRDMVEHFGQNHPMTYLKVFGNDSETLSTFSVCHALKRAADVIKGPSSSVFYPGSRPPPDSSYYTLLEVALICEFYRIVSHIRGAIEGLANQGGSIGCAIFCLRKLNNKVQKMEVPTPKALTSVVANTNVSCKDMLGVFEKKGAVKTTKPTTFELLAAAAASKEPATMHVEEALRSLSEMVTGPFEQEAFSNACLNLQANLLKISSNERLNELSRKAIQIFNNLQEQDNMESRTIFTNHISKAIGEARKNNSDADYVSILCSSASDLKRKLLDGLSSRFGDFALNRKPSKAWQMCLDPRLHNLPTIDQEEEGNRKTEYDEVFEDMVKEMGNVPEEVFEEEDCESDVYDLTGQQGFNRNASSKTRLNQYFTYVCSLGARRAIQSADEFWSEETTQRLFPDIFYLAKKWLPVSVVGNRKEAGEQTVPNEAAIVFLSADE